MLYLYILNVTADEPALLDIIITGILYGCVCVSVNCSEPTICEENVTVAWDVRTDLPHKL